MDSRFQNLEPIIYDEPIDVRFQDLDPYGHVNASVYLDYVFSARWNACKRLFDKSAHDFLNQGLAFFLAELRNQKFLRPINGMQTIRVESWVSEVSGARFLVTFRVCDSAKKRDFCTGLLEFAIVDVATQRPTEMPDWGIPYFFRAKTQ